jgi:hypothetical protein
MDTINPIGEGPMSGVAPAVISGVVALVVAGAGIAATALGQKREYTHKISQEETQRKQALEGQEEKLRAELQNSLKLQEERIRMEMRTVFMAEEAIRELLMAESFRQGRTFEMIKRKVGGWDHDEDELRRLLVRCGAIRFYRTSDKAEMWGLRSRLSKEQQES